MQHVFIVQPLSILKKIQGGTLLNSVIVSFKQSLSVQVGVLINDGIWRRASCLCFDVEQVLIRRLKFPNANLPKRSIALCSDGPTYTLH
jgi:hypothetical protein